MKKLIFTFIAILSILVVTLPVHVSVAESLNPQTIITDNHTVQEEAEGKEIWEKLQAKQLECQNLTHDNFEVLGEYFMGQRLGISHESMNNMMKEMMGEAGETQMHVSLGKRLSGCDVSVSYPNSDFGFMPMMWMMGSAFAPWSFGGTKGGGWSMMGNYYGNMMGGWGILGVITWILMITFLVLGIIYFWKEINRKK